MGLICFRDATEHGFILVTSTVENRNLCWLTKRGTGEKGNDSQEKAHFPRNPFLYSPTTHFTYPYASNLKINWTPWPESASELYRPSHRCLAATFVPNLRIQGVLLVTKTDLYCHILGFLDRYPSNLK
jgi:hypothetical protein